MVDGTNTSGTAGDPAGTDDKAKADAAAKAAADAATAGSKPFMEIGGKVYASQKELEDELAELRRDAGRKAEADKFQNLVQMGKKAYAEGDMGAWRATMREFGMTEEWMDTQLAKLKGNGTAAQTATTTTDTDDDEPAKPITFDRFDPNIQQFHREMAKTHDAVLELARRANEQSVRIALAEDDLVAKYWGALNSRQRERVIGQAMTEPTVAKTIQNKGVLSNVHLEAARQAARTFVQDVYGTPELLTRKPPVTDGMGLGGGGSDLTTKYTNEELNGIDWTKPISAETEAARREKLSRMLEMTFAQQERQESAQRR